MRFGADRQVLGQRSYGIYGEVLDEQGFGAVSEGFTGASYERAFDLSVFEARAMAGATGRFLSPDPVLLHVTSPPLSPQALNPFAYSFNRPLTHIDPEGRFAGWSFAVTGVFTAIDIGQYAVGNLTHGQFAAAMALNAAAFVADIGTAGAGGGLAVRFGNLAVKSARGITHTEGAYMAGKAAIYAKDEIEQGNYGNALVLSGLAALGTKVTQRRVRAQSLGNGGRKRVRDLSNAPRAPDFVVTPRGEAIPIPGGARGPFRTRGSGMEYVGGSGGKGLHEKVTGVRIMDATNRHRNRVIYENSYGQGVDRFTGKTVSRAEYHLFLKE